MLPDNPRRLRLADTEMRIELVQDPSGDPSRPIPVIVVQDLRNRHGTYVERSMQDRARSSAEGAVDEADRLLRDRAVVAGRLASGYETHWVDPARSD